MESIYTLGTGSASHTYGNVALFIRQLLERFFPKDFFTYVHLDGTISWKNIRDVLGAAEFKTRHYPYLIITPNYNDTEDDDIFMSNTALMSNWDNVVAGIHRNTIFPIVVDQQHGSSLCYKINRDRITFDVEIRCRSMVQQIDLKKNLRNGIVWDRSYTQKACLESMIPRSMIEYMGKIADIDITDTSTNQVPLIMSYLNGHARYPITYKVRNSTSVDEFFMYYKTNMLLRFEDLKSSPPSKKNSVDEYAPITFTVTAEFNLPGIFALVGTHERQFHGFRFDALVETGDTMEMIPMYTYTNLYDRFASDTLNGLSFYSAIVVKAEEKNAGKDEVVDLKDVLPDTHLSILRTLVADNVEPGTVFYFRLLKDSHEIPSNCETAGEASQAEWEVDWRRMHIIIHNADYMVTYRLIIYANMVLLNSRFAEMQDKTKGDIPAMPGQAK